jgi:hypothetical protein
MGTGSKTEEQKCDWYKMGVQKQTKRRWTGNQKQGRLVCKGYAQVEGVYFEETFSPVSRMEAIKMILAYACSKRIKVYQMDVKSTFLNGELEEEVYIEQPEGFLLSERGRLCLQIEEISVWTQAIP